MATLFQYSLPLSYHRSVSSSPCSTSGFKCSLPRRTVAHNIHSREFRNSRRDIIFRSAIDEVSFVEPPPPPPPPFGESKGELIERLKLKLLIVEKKKQIEIGESHTWKELNLTSQSRCRSSMEEFLAIRQETTIKDYQERFQILASKLQGLSDEELENIHFHGLKPLFRVEVRLLRPKNLREMNEATQMIENKYRVLKATRVGSGYNGSWSKSGSGSGSSDSIPRFSMIFVMTTSFGEETLRTPIETTNTFRSSSTMTTGHDGPDQRKMLQEETMATRNSSTYKQFTDSEFLSRRVKGLCCCCEERYSPGHVYKNRQLQVMIVADAGPVEETGDEDK